MDNNAFMSVDDVAAILGISKSYAYKVVRELNKDLKAMGYLTVAAKVSKRYFMEKYCYGERKNKEKE